MATTRKISAIILAAGFSRRMGQNKLLLPFRNRSLIAHTLALAAALPFYEVILVSSVPTIDCLRVRGELPGKIRVLVNSSPESGQSESLRLGIEAAGGEAYMFFTGDQPLLDERTILAILGKDSPGHIVVPRTERGPSSPALFCASFREELLESTGDTGGRHVREKYPEQCLYAEVPNAALLMDVDTPEQYRRLLDYASGERRTSVLSE